MDYEVITVDDERAKELAQILLNEKAISILHLLENRTLSISEISKELGLPISTVSYHVDKMLKVGLVEIAGKRYGKRFQTVKLYRASNRPILLISEKNISKTPSNMKKIYIISLSVAGLVATGVYLTFRGIIWQLVSSENKTFRMASTSTQKLNVSSAPDVSSIVLTLGFVVITFILAFLFVFNFLKRRS